LLLSISFSALKDIESNKFSLRKAALQYNIPKSTLMVRKQKYNNGFHGSGTTTILSKETEQLLVQMMKCFGDWGHVLTFNAV
jgi:hypothetical protein